MKHLCLSSITIAGLLLMLSSAALAEETMPWCEPQKPLQICLNSPCLRPADRPDCPDIIECCD